MNEEKEDEENKEKITESASPTSGDIFSKEKEALSDLSSCIGDCQKLIKVKTSKNK